MTNSERTNQKICAVYQCDEAREHGESFCAFHSENENCPFECFYCREYFEADDAKICDGESYCADCLREKFLTEPRIDPRMKYYD